MRFVLILWCLGELAAGQQLRVKSATARSVQLDWDGAAGPVTIERAAGSAFQKLATASQASYEDNAIDPFATYRYRVSVSGKSSNEVVVGPPPAGVLNVAPVPKGTEPPKYGTASAIGLDENGDPIVAFEWLDPNGDADNSDSDVRFVRWSRATRKWLPAVKAQVVTIRASCRFRREMAHATSFFIQTDVSYTCCRKKAPRWLRSVTTVQTGR